MSYQEIAEVWYVALTIKIMICIDQLQRSSCVVVLAGHMTPANEWGTEWISTWMEHDVK